MDSNYRNTKSTTFQDLDYEARERALRSFGEVIKNRDPITSTLLDEWVSGSDDRAAMLDGMVFAGIRWSKSLGRPKTEFLAGGFSIVHEVRKVAGQATPAGLEETSKWLPAGKAPFTKDVSSDSEYRLQISFLAILPSKFEKGEKIKGNLHQNRLLLTFAQVPWGHARMVGPGYLLIDPYSRPPFISDGRPYVIPDYVVKRYPYSRGPSVHPLGPSEEFDPSKPPKGLDE